MKNVTISEDAYNEFREFLNQNKVEDLNIRINLGGMSCSGPMFNIEVGEATDDDIVETINEINFIVEKRLIDDFGGFIILSSEENNGRGLSLKPVIEAEGGCGSCSGGCH